MSPSELPGPRAPPIPEAFPDWFPDVPVVCQRGFIKRWRLHSLHFHITPICLNPALRLPWTGLHTQRRDCAAAGNGSPPSSGVHRNSPAVPVGAVGRRLRENNLAVSGSSLLPAVESAPTPGDPVNE